MPARKSWRARRRSSTRAGRKPVKTSRIARASPARRTRERPRPGGDPERVDDAQVHEPHAWRLARCRPEPGEVEDIHEQPRDGQQRCDVRGRPVGVQYERSDESDHGGSCQQDDRCERGIHRECDSTRCEAPVGDWRHLAGSRDLGSRASAEQAAGATLDGVVESVHAVADATGRLLGKRLRLPLDRSAQLGARQDIREREPECGVVKDSLGEVERQLALQRVGQRALESGTGQDLRDDSLGPLALARRQTLRFELGARRAPRLPLAR